MIKIAITDFPGYYACDNGQIWSEKTHRYLKANDRCGGYLCVTLSKGKERVSKNIHRLIAEAFIPNPNGYETVNHKDENKNNNTASNLEWVTRAYNNTYGTRVKRASFKQRNNERSKAVNQYDKSGNFIATFQSTKEAWRLTGICRTAIGKVANHVPKYNTAGGYVWRFADEVSV